jgi:YbbR domain-containing protein
LAGEIPLSIDIKPMDNIDIIDQSATSTIMYIDKKRTKNLSVIAEITQYMTEAGITLTPSLRSSDIVTVSGPDKVLQTLDHAQVNLNLSTYGKIDKPLNVSEKIILINAEGEEVRNQNIKTDQTSAEVYISVTTAKTVPLNLSYRHEYYTPKNTVITVTPPEIQIEGSPDSLNGIDEIELGPIDEKTIEEDTTMTMEILLPNDVIIKNANSTTAVVKIEFIDTGKRTMSFSTSNCKVIPPGNNFDYHIKDERLQLRLIGAEPNLSSLRQSGITASVDLSKITEKGIQEVPVDVAVTSGKEKEVFCVGEYVISVEIY